MLLRDHATDVVRATDELVKFIGNNIGSILHSLMRSIKTQRRRASNKYLKYTTLSK